jgi:hypothetical protein|tara:strand:+ start:11661 stop:11840 length:180 start_codon:yes stop_codon:yes gene_type:complete
MLISSTHGRAARAFLILEPQRFAQRMPVTAMTTDWDFSAGAAAEVEGVALTVASAVAAG